MTDLRGMTSIFVEMMEETDEFVTYLLHYFSVHFS